jgi:hypothetical protein
MNAPKENAARHEYEGLDWGCPVRLETRAGEFTGVASLRAEARRRSESECPAASARGLPLKGGLVTPVRPEAGRSTPGQGEAGPQARWRPDRDGEVQIPPVTWE